MMSVYIDTTAYKSLTTVFPNGCPMAVSGDSLVIGVEKVYLSDYPIECGIGNDQPYMMLLRIIEPQYGDLWIDETAQSFADKIGQASGSSADRTRSITYTIGDPGAPVAGNTIIIPELIGASAIIGITLDGVGAQNIPVDLSLGELDFTSIGGLSNGVVITVEYNY